MEEEEDFEDEYEEHLPVVVEATDELDEDRSKAEAEPVEIVEPEIIEPDKNEQQSKDAAREKNKTAGNKPKKKRRRKRTKIYVAPSCP